MLHAGFAEIDITPAPGLPRAGMPHPQRGQGVEWPLMARVAVFDDGVRRAAIVALDLLFLTAQTVAEYRQAITAGAALAPADVMITCTHTHWAPHTTAIMDEDADNDYLDLVRDRLMQATARAVRNLAPAVLRAGSVDAPGWAFNRRPIYRTPFGEQVGTQGPLGHPDFLRMEGPADPQLQVLAAYGADDRALGGLVNFACHTTIGPDEALYSADYPGPLTARLAAQHGGVFAFLQGCAGNVWQVDKSLDPPVRMNGSAHLQRMGEALAARADAALAGAAPVRGDQIRVAHTHLCIPQRRPTPEQVALARTFLEQRPPDLDWRAHHRRMTGREWTFYTDWAAADTPPVCAHLEWQEDWFARGTLGLWEWQRRVGGRQLIEDVEVQAIAIGDVALIGYPGEIFCEFGLRTRAASPFTATFVAELANGWHGYVPTVEAFAHGGYEPRLGDASRLIPEAGDMLLDAGVSLLRALA